MNDSAKNGPVISKLDADANRRPSGLQIGSLVDSRLLTVVAGARKVLSNSQKSTKNYLSHFSGRRDPGRPGSFTTAVSPRSGGGRFLAISFFTFVILPAVFALFYYTFFASDVYVTEAKITVRESVSSTPDAKTTSSTAASSLLSKVGIGRSGVTAQDTMIVLDYLKSRAVISDIGGRERLKSFYDRSDVDWLSRLDSSKDMETLWGYWNNRVTASVDTMSSILTLRVRAYRPDDAVALSQQLIARSEELINRISRRSREDALRRASDEVVKSMRELAEIRSQILAFQQHTNSIDPLETAKQLTALVSSLTIQKIEMESRLTASERAGTRDRPGEQYMRTQIGVINRQIDELNAKLTGKDSPTSVSTQLKDYEVLKLRQEFSEQIYTLARSSFEEARRQLDKQQLYLVVVVPPALPDYGLYPRPLVDAGLIMLGCLVLWAIGALLVAAVRDSANF